MAVRIGKYAIRTRLARGGMAELFLATAEGPEGFVKTVVVKRLLPHLAENPAIVSMFLEEARLAAGLQHPNVVQVYELGRQGEDPYICMEYLAGRDLAALVARTRELGVPIPCEVAAHLASGVAQGLHFAHCHQIVHGDVSPANVVATFVGEVKIVDFGIARTVGQERAPLPGALQGKLAYLAPEQISGGASDRRSDVFALGVVLHELLTGERLFRRDNEAATIEAVVREPIPDPRARRPEVPPALASVVMRALERDPRRRFATADELRAGLESFLATRAWMPTCARLGSYLIRTFGESDARRALAPPEPEPTGTQTDAAPPPPTIASPVGGVPAVRLVAEARRRGTRQWVRVVGEVPLALMKAGQELVAVPLHFVQSAQRWTRSRLALSAIAMALAGFALGSHLRELQESALAPAPHPPPRATTPPRPRTAEEGDPYFALLGQTLVPPGQIALPGPVASLPPRRRAPRVFSQPKSTGRLVMAARGTVLLRGMRLGEGPLARDLPPGNYDVTLLDARGVPRTWIAVVRAGKTTRLSCAP